MSAAPGFVVRTSSLLLAAIAAASCSAPTSIEIFAKRSEVPIAGRVEIGARVSNPSAELSYRWFADAGYLDPQDGDQPSTTYIAPAEPGRNRIRVEVLRGSTVVATAETTIAVVAGAEKTAQPVDVKVPARGNPPGTLAQGVPGVRITSTLPHDQVGGPTTSVDIAGVVEGVEPSMHRIVLYARTDQWYIQPLVDAPATRIQEDGSWSTWTHTGIQYAALLVRATGAEVPYAPPARLTTLPAVGGPIVARTIVEGSR